MKYFDSIALFEKECTLQTFWAFSSRQNSSTQVLLVMVVKHLKDIVSKTEKANLQPLLMVAFPFQQQQQRMATQQKTICTFMVSYEGCFALLWHFLKCKNRKCQNFLNELGNFKQIFFYILDFYTLKTVRLKQCSHSIYMFSMPDIAMKLDGVNENGTFRIVFIWIRNFVE